MPRTFSRGTSAYIAVGAVQPYSSKSEAGIIPARDFCAGTDVSDDSRADYFGTAILVGNKHRLSVRDFWRGRWFATCSCSDSMGYSLGTGDSNQFSGSIAECYFRECAELVDWSTESAGSSTASFVWNSCRSVRCLVRFAPP